jgi:hypothetical protein
LEVIQVMVQARPDRSGRRTPDPAIHMVPLHAAAELLSLEAVDFLATAWPRGLQVRDKDGWLPLPFSAAREDPDAAQVVQRITDGWAPGLEVSDGAGCLPVHIAAHRGEGWRWSRSL